MRRLSAGSLVHWVIAGAGLASPSVARARQVPSRLADHALALALQRHPSVTGMVSRPSPSTSTAACSNRKSVAA